MSARRKPLAFRLFKTHHDRHGAEQLAQRIWQELSDRDCLQVRAISASGRAMDSHVTYVARGGNSHDIRRRYFDEWDEDDSAVDDYTIAAMIDLDALGLTDLDRITVSDAFYNAIVETRKALLANASEPPKSQPSRERKILVPDEVPEPPNEVVERSGGTVEVTYVKTSERRSGGPPLWDEALMKAVKVVDHRKGRELSLPVGLMLAGDARSSYWVRVPKPG